MNADELKAELHALKQVAGASEKRNRGRRFEAWLTALFDVDRLEARGSYRPKGEEVDGSLMLDGRVLLFEAKWTESALPASSIYAFKGKVDGKLVGTIGVYISMAGFSQDTIDALARGKDLNVILVDEEDLKVALDLGPRLVLRQKLRAAAERGIRLLPSQSGSGNTCTVASTASSRASAWRSTRSRSWSRGASTEQFVARAAARLLGERRSRPASQVLIPDVEVDVVAAGGLSQMAAVAAAILDANPLVPRVAVIVDGDYDDEVQRIAEIGSDARLVGRPVEVIVAQPTLPTAWVGSEPAMSLDLEEYLQAFDARELDDLRREPSFVEFELLVDDLLGASPPS